MHRSIPAVFLILGLAAGAPALAQKERNASSAQGYEQPASYDDQVFRGNADGWETIGTKSINSRVDQDHVEVPGGDRHNAIRLCASEHAFELIQLSVRFHNGDMQDFNANQVVEPGRCTNAFDFAGRQRNISKINLKYAKLRHGQQPQVFVQAR